MITSRGKEERDMYRYSMLGPIVFLLAGTVFVGGQGPAQKNEQAVLEKTGGYAVPSEPIKLETEASKQALLAAKKVAVIAFAKPAITVEQRSRREIRVTEHGGIKRKVDVNKAKNELERTLKKWGRFTLVAQSADADLVFVIFDESVPPSGFTRAIVKDTQYRLKDTVAVFKGGSQEDSKRQALWMHADSETAFSALGGSLSDGIVSQLRKEVEEAEKTTKK